MGFEPVEAIVLNLPHSSKRSPRLRPIIAGLDRHSVTTPRGLDMRVPVFTLTLIYNMFPWALVSVSLGEQSHATETHYALNCVHYIYIFISKNILASWVIFTKNKDAHCILLLRTLMAHMNKIIDLERQKHGCFTYSTAWLLIYARSKGISQRLRSMNTSHDDVIKWKHFPGYWPFVRGIHRSPVNSRETASGAELWCFLWSASE